MQLFDYNGWNGWGLLRLSLLLYGSTQWLTQGSTQHEVGSEREHPQCENLWMRSVETLQGLQDPSPLLLFIKMVTGWGRVQGSGLGSPSLKEEYKGIALCFSPGNTLSPVTRDQMEFPSLDSGLSLGISQAFKWNPCSIFLYVYEIL